MASRPYSKLIEIYHFTLDQIEKDACFDKENPAVIELRQSLLRRIADLEGRSREPSDEAAE
jgi:uncharacterized protein (DUF488 family)